MKHRRLVIVGCGVVGAAVFRRMSQCWGSDVLLIEKARPGDGATGFSGGILRGFHLDSRLSDACLRGVRFYRDLADGHDLRIERTGFLHLVDTEHIEEARRKHARLSGQLALEWLAPQAAKSRFGLTSVEGLAAAVFEPEAGYLDPLQLTRLLAQLGREVDGEIMTGVELQGLVVDGEGGLRLDTNAGEIASEHLVLCAGAWTPDLARRLNAQLPSGLRSKVIQINRIERPLDAELPAFVDHSTGAYGRPDGCGAALVGCPVDQWDINPDRMDTPSRAWREHAQRRAALRFAWMREAASLGGYRRHDAYDVSGHGVVDWCEHPPGVLVAAGFSGNGVKLAPSAAERIAELLLEVETREGTVA